MPEVTDARGSTAAKGVFVEANTAPAGSQVEDQRNNKTYRVQEDGTMREFSLTGLPVPASVVYQPGTPWYRRNRWLLYGLAIGVVIIAIDRPDRPAGDTTSIDDVSWGQAFLIGCAQVASLWPGIAGVRTVRVHGTAAQGQLLHGWLRSRLGRDDVRLELVETERLEGIDLDGEPAPFPPGDPPSPSEVLSEELDRFTRDRIYEAAVRAVAG